MDTSTYNKSTRARERERDRERERKIKRKRKRQESAGESARDGHRQPGRKAVRQIDTDSRAHRQTDR